jgi:DNA-directed RNA polymerase sigma subunit (sigma70/sigma32)
MDTRPKSGELIEATVEEVAAWLSATEGRAVSGHEVRRIEAQALRKLRQEFTRRGLSPADLLPDR